jgi:hypothetical protein
MVSVTSLPEGSLSVSARPFCGALRFTSAFRRRNARSKIQPSLFVGRAFEAILVDVAIEELAIQIPWVPINKNAAEIEHGDGAFSHEEKNSNWENDSGRGFSIQRVWLSVEVSADGKMLTMTMHIPGRSAPNVRVFDRE